MDNLITYVLLVFMTAYQCSAFRTDLNSGVISFNNVFFAPFPIGSPVKMENDHFRMRLQKYYSLLWSCTVLLTVFDKSIKRTVDFAKLPCGVQYKVRKEGGHLQVGEIMYDRGLGELVFMLIGGGCVVRNYLKDEKGKVELRTTIMHEHQCRAMKLGEGN